MHIWMQTYISIIYNMYKCVKKMRKKTTCYNNELHEHQSGTKDLCCMYMSKKVYRNEYVLIAITHYTLTFNIFMCVFGTIVLIIGCEVIFVTLQKNKGIICTYVLLVVLARLLRYTHVLYIHPQTQLLRGLQELPCPSICPNVVSAHELFNR